MSIRHVVLSTCVLGFLVACANNPGAPTPPAAKPEACSKVLAEPLPTPIKFAPGLLDKMSKMLRIAPDKLVDGLRQAGLNDYNARRSACMDTSCVEITHAQGNVPLDGGPQKPYTVECFDQYGNESQRSYMPPPAQTTVAPNAQSDLLP